MAGSALMAWCSEEQVYRSWLMIHFGLCSKIVKQIDMMGIDMVFVVGGNGGNAGANAIQNKCEEQGVVCSVIGIPKSIDNDILLVRSNALEPFNFRCSALVDAALPRNVRSTLVITADTLQLSATANCCSTN